MAARNHIAVTRSSGNVFRDLGFPRAEAEHLLIRADLMLRLQKTIAGRGLKQAAAALGPALSSTLRAPNRASLKSNGSRQSRSPTFSVSRVLRNFRVYLSVFTSPKSCTA